jgi:hypothetical protein
MSAFDNIKTGRFITFTVDGLPVQFIAKSGGDCDMPVAFKAEANQQLSVQGLYDETVITGVYPISTSTINFCKQKMRESLAGTFYVGELIHEDLTLNSDGTQNSIKHVFNNAVLQRMAKFEGGNERGGTIDMTIVFSCNDYNHELSLQGEQ